MPTYSLIPNPMWMLRDRNGLPAGGAKLYVYLASDKSTPSSWYKDSAAVSAWTNPIVFDDANGVQGPFYAEDGILYYLKAYDSAGNLLFAIDNIDAPTASGGSPTINYNETVNLFNNGDFRFNYYNNTVKDVSSIITDVLLADGGWSFKKNNITGTDKLEFISFTPGQVDVLQNPIYYLNYSCTSAGTGEEKYIYFRFPNVNTFASDSTNVISLALEAKSSTSTPIEAYYRQFFGTGGSSDVSASLGTIALNPTWSRYELTNKLIASVTGKTITDDSYLEIQIRITPNVISSVDMTKFQLEYAATISPYEYEPDQENRSKTIGGILPRVIPGNLTGQTDYCSPTYNTDGTMLGTYGGTVPVGAVVDWYTETAPDGWLFCNGDSYTIVGDDKTYTRLYDAIGQRGGIGSDAFFISDGASGEEFFKTTSGGTITAPNAGTSGFIIATTLTGTSGAPFYCYNYTAATAQNYVTFTAQTPGNPLFAATTGTATGVSLVKLSQDNTDSIRAKYRFTFPAASALTAGQYITISSPTTLYYFWFEIAGVGPDPAPGGTGVKVVLNASDTDVQVAQAVTDAVRGVQIVSVQFTGPTGLEGKYFDISGPTITWRPYYTVDGIGTAPTGGAGIVVFPVAVLSSDAAADVATKTKTVMSALQFQVPDTRDMFSRGWNNIVSPFADAQIREVNQYQDPSLYDGNHVGSYQNDEFKQHIHSYDVHTATSGSVLTKAENSQSAATFDTNASGGFESRPYNIAFMRIMKY